MGLRRLATLDEGARVGRKTPVCAWWRAGLRMLCDVITSLVFCAGSGLRAEGCVRLPVPQGAGETLVAGTVPMPGPRTPATRT
ncbi:hypothetical protein [Mycolicibacterium aromaticivorans]|uniref:hypothetical protein n=1 Tax=Mycolicibacterium aromaticivorans TaxID=318425 RepID=UPI00103E1CD3|nr:hypothetical protein [Mycolicibacterium aromaticivorans]